LSFSLSLSLSLSAYWNFFGQTSAAVGQKFFSSLTSAFFTLAPRLSKYALSALAGSFNCERVKLTSPLRSDGGHVADDGQPDTYRDWNPLNLRADGDPVLGARVRMTFIDPGHPGRMITQYVQVIAAEAPARLAWVGSVPLLFRGQHCFELSGSGEVTEMRHGERLSGLLPRLWAPPRIEQQRLAYQAMNDSLLRRLNLLFRGRTEFR
jgi:hypothetical protein